MTRTTAHIWYLQNKRVHTVYTQFWSLNVPSSGPYMCTKLWSLYVYQALVPKYVPIVVPSSGPYICPKLWSLNMSQALVPKYVPSSGP